MALDPGIGIPQQHRPSQQVILHPEAPDLEDPSGLNSVENRDKFSLKLAIRGCKTSFPSKHGDFCMDEYLEAANLLADCPDFWHVPPVGLWPRSLSVMGTPFIAVSNRLS